MDNGWIKIHRQILKWGWWDDHNTSRLFFYLLLSANHEEKVWHGITIKRGEHLTSLAKLAKATGISVRSVRTSLTHLKSTGELTNCATSKYRIIKLNNYDSYQMTDKVADKQPTKYRQSTDNKQELKELKNIKTLTKVSVQKTPSQVMKEFCVKAEQGDFEPFLSLLVDRGLERGSAAAELLKFYAYWSEPTRSGHKQRWETQPTFEVRRRLASWFGRIREAAPSAKDPNYKPPKI